MPFVVVVRPARRLAVTVEARHAGACEATDCVLALCIRVAVVRVLAALVNVCTACDTVAAVTSRAVASVARAVG